MKKLPLTFLLIALLAGCTGPQYQKEDILVTGTSQPVISLNGTWKFTLNPPENFYSDDVSDENWADIKVPGECAMQGFAIRHNKPVAYRTSIKIPEDYDGKTIKLKFEGVYSYAKVWVNGNYIRDHSGGFTSWDCDITPYVEPGEEALIALEVTDMNNEISYASGYAKHQIGGILRSVSLLALPEDFPQSISIHTVLDSRYTDAGLNIKIKGRMKEKTWINFRLYDKNGKVLTMSDKMFLIEDTVTLITLQVKKPAKWDSEHPTLYTLVTSVFDKSKVTASFKTAIGFRKIEVVGNQLLVNGEKVKLRGACRHDMHPLLGRVSTPDFDKTDVLLAKEANMNFIRTSHYPPSEDFLRYCDEYGIYVEDETAVCFVDTHRSGIYKSLKQSGPEFEPQIISQVMEMVNNHQNHPSVILWSLGNESTFNESFKKCYDYVKSVDPTRPVIFSYPGSVPDSVKYYDILSMHYPSFSGDIDQGGVKLRKFNSGKIPALFDEWAHVPCYDKKELIEDMNVRNFWGQSLDSMWTNVFLSDGGLGGAIWGMIDETFMLPDTMSGYNEWWGIQEETNGIRMFEGPDVGYGEWGIVDVWRRRKPEFWNTKKAYSPIKITIDEITGFKPGRPIEIPVFNRFNHTNMREITTKWTYRGKEHLAAKDNIPPSGKGRILLLLADWTEGEYINFKFYRDETNFIDEYNIRLGKRIPVLPESDGHVIKTEEQDGSVVKITGNGFSAILNKKSGLLENVVSKNDTLIKSGPWLHYTFPSKSHWSVVPVGILTDAWKPEKITYGEREGIFIISTQGSYGKLSVGYKIEISGNGAIKIIYNINGMDEGSKVQELGLKFLAGSCFDSLSWDRKSLWNAYPPLHTGMPEGVVSLNHVNKNLYRVRPAGQWEYDNMSFYYNGLSGVESLSYIAGSMKEDIYSYTLSTADKSMLSVYSKAEKACRITKTGTNINLYINKLWDYNSLRWGNYMKNLQLSAKITDTVYLKINN